MVELLLEGCLRYLVEQAGQRRNRQINPLQEQEQLAEVEVRLAAVKTAVEAAERQTVPV